MKPETLDKLVGKTPPEAALGERQREEHGSALDMENSVVDEKWMHVQKPDMSTGGEWIDVDVTTQPALGASALFDMRSDPLEIAITLQKALHLQWAALGEGSVLLKKKGQEKQVLDQLKKIESSAQQCVVSIKLWKATAKEIEIGLKDLRDGDSK